MNEIIGKGILYIIGTFVTFGFIFMLFMIIKNAIQERTMKTVNSLFGGILFAVASLGLLALMLFNKDSFLFFVFFILFLGSCFVCYLFFHSLAKDVDEIMAVQEEIQKKKLQYLKSFKSEKQEREKLQQTSKQITEETEKRYQTKKAKDIFKWILANINYDYEVLEKLNDKYFNSHYTERNGVQTFKDAKGLCGEQGRLFIDMATEVGLKSKYVHVSKDNEGKEVNHACAGLILSDNTIVLVDPAYHTFNIKHQEWKFADSEVS